MQEVTVVTTNESLLATLKSCNGVPAPLGEIDGRWSYQDELDTVAPTTTVVKKGRFSIKGSSLKLPECEFVVSQTESTAFFRSVPYAPWPVITFSTEVSGSITADWSVVGKTSPVNIRSRSNTASAYIFQCLTYIDLAQSRDWELELEGRLRIQAGVIVDAGEIEKSERRLDFFRLVRMIETEFGVEFALPQYISPEEEGMIHSLSQAIEEGTLTIPTNEWVIPFDCSDRNREALEGLLQPKALAVQTFRGMIRLFDRELDFGPVELYIKACQVADGAQLVELIKSNCPGELRLKVLSGEVVYRFERYLKLTQEEIEEAEMGALMESIHQKLKKAGALEEDTLAALSKTREAVFQKLYPNIK
jgi:hypothetical protein